MGYQAPARALGVARFMEMQDNKPEDNSGSEDNKRWYVVHAYSGFEKSVAQALRDRIVRTGMDARFGAVLVPTEEEVGMRSGHARKSVVSGKRWYGRVEFGVVLINTKK